MKIYKIIKLYTLYSISSTLMGTEYDFCDPSNLGYGIIQAKKFKNTKEKFKDTIRLKGSINERSLKFQKNSLDLNFPRPPYIEFVSMQKLQQRFDLARSQACKALLIDDFEINSWIEIIELLTEFSQYHLTSENSPKQNAIIKALTILIKQFKEIVKEKISQK